MSLAYLTEEEAAETQRQFDSAVWEVASPRDTIPDTLPAASYAPAQPETCGYEAIFPDDAPTIRIHREELPF
jgi:hypothetical protein